jgi:hypothetical protein
MRVSTEAQYAAVNRLYLIYVLIQCERRLHIRSEPTQQVRLVNEAL